MRTCNPAKFRAAALVLLTSVSVCGVACGGAGTVTTPSVAPVVPAVPLPAPQPRGLPADTPTAARLVISDFTIKPVHTSAEVRFNLAETGHVSGATIVEI